MLRYSPIVKPVDPASQTAAATRLDDRALLQAVALGDATALASLRGRHEAGLRRFLCARLRDADLAEEVLADVFLAVWRGAGGYRGEATVRSWMYGVAARRARDTRRAAGVLTTPATDLVEPADPDAGPAEALLGLPSAHGLVERIAALPGGLRDVLALAFDQRMTYAEIAAVLGVPVGTVRRRLHEARRRLRPPR